MFLYDSKLGDFTSRIGRYFEMENIIYTMHLGESNLLVVSEKL